MLNERDAQNSFARQSWKYFSYFFDTVIGENMLPGRKYP